MPPKLKPPDTGVGAEAGAAVDAAGWAPPKLKPPAAGGAEALETGAEEAGAPNRLGWELAAVAALLNKLGCDAGADVAAPNRDGTGADPAAEAGEAPKTLAPAAGAGVPVVLPNREGAEPDAAGVCVLPPKEKPPPVEAADIHQGVAVGFRRKRSSRLTEYAHLQDCQHKGASCEVFLLELPPNRPPDASVLIPDAGAMEGAGAELAAGALPKLKPPAATDEAGAEAAPNMVAPELAPPLAGWPKALVLPKVLPPKRDPEDAPPPNSEPPVCAVEAGALGVPNAGADCPPPNPPKPGATVTALLAGVPNAPAPTVGEEL